MTVVALALAAGWALSLAAVLRLQRAERRDAKNERATLVNQILHLTGRTWASPPAASNGHSPEPVALSYTTHPEALDWEDTDV